MWRIGDKWCEKGIDTLLLAEALEFADKKGSKAVVLVGGDGDHVTLLERLPQRGIDTVLVYYNSADKAAPGTWTHLWRTERAKHSLRMDFDDGFRILTEEESRVRIARRGKMIADYRKVQQRPSPGQPVARAEASVEIRRSIR